MLNVSHVFCDLPFLIPTECSLFCIAYLPNMSFLDNQVNMSWMDMCQLLCCMVGHYSDISDCIMLQNVHLHNLKRDISSKFLSGDQVNAFIKENINVSDIRIYRVTVNCENNQNAMLISVIVKVEGDDFEDVVQFLTCKMYFKRVIFLQIFNRCTCICYQVIN